MLQICKELFGKWNDYSIKYCHWKSNEHLAAGLNGETDLDILLDKSFNNQVCHIFKSLDFLPCKSQYGSRYPNVEDWIGFDKETGKLIHIHLHYTMITGHKGMKEYYLPWSTDVLNTRIIDEQSGIYISDPNWEIITLYTRICLKATFSQKEKARNESYQTDEDIVREIEFLKKHVEWNKVRSNLYLYYKESSSVILEIMKESEINPSKFLELVNVIEVEMKPYNRYGSLTTALLKHYYRLVITAMAWLKRKKNHTCILRKTPKSQKGIVIAFLGQDGAGKSTITEEIEKWLKWKLEVRRFYLGSGDHFMSWEKKLQGKLADSRFPLLKLFQSFLAVTIYCKISRRVLRDVKRANYYSSKGGIALFDRFPQVLYPNINDGPKIRYRFVQKSTSFILKTTLKIFANIEERNLKDAVCYSPKVVIKLILPPEESIRRKPQENIELIRKKHEIIKSLQFDNSHVYEIDATDFFDKELIRIKNIIWGEIMNSY